eukprot:scaffold3763_cov165-Amphora_coffeaeformis.AAC.12
MNQGLRDPGSLLCLSYFSTMYFSTMIDERRPTDHKDFFVWWQKLERLMGGHCEKSGFRVLRLRQRQKTARKRNFAQNLE